MQFNPHFPSNRQHLLFKLFVPRIGKSVSRLEKLMTLASGRSDYA